MVKKHFQYEIICGLKSHYSALAGVAQWIERGPVNRRVTSSILSQGICLG